MDITIRHLQSFLAVSRSKNFTRAAHELHISQSRLSRVIADLERSLRVPLIERNTRSLTLTAEGEELLVRASPVVKDFEEMLDNYSSYLSGSYGKVNIATLPSLAASLLPKVIIQFRKTHPTIDMGVQDLLSSDSLQALLSGTAEVGLTGTGYLIPGKQPVQIVSKARFVVQPLIDDRFFAVFPKGHHFESKEGVTWEELSREKIIAFSSGASVQQIMQIGMSLANTSFEPHMRAGNLLAVGGLVAAGLGVSTVPALIKPLLDNLDVDFRPMLAPVLTRQVGLVRNAGRRASPPAIAFWNAMAGLPELEAELPEGAAWTPMP